MKKNLFIFVLMMSLSPILTGLVKAQKTNDTNLKHIFGESLGTTEEVFDFSSNYKIDVERQSEKQIITIYLNRKETASEEAKLGITDVKRFFQKVNLVSPMGHMVSSGTLSASRYSHPDFWDIYENVLVHRYAELFDNKLYTVGLEVEFPRQINGLIKKVEKQNMGGKKALTTIWIEKCSYFTLNDKTQAGNSGDFWVIGPINEVNGKCIGFNTDFDLKQFQ
jgi:hypothetical protein